MKLYFLDAQLAKRHLTALAPELDAGRVFDTHRALREGTPLFFSGVRPAPIWFEYGVHLGNGWEGSTLRQYAYVTLRLARFLELLSIDLTAVTESHLANYRESRTTNGPRPISAVSWKVEAVAIRVLFTYLVDAQVIDRLPWISHGNRDVLRQPVRTQPNVRHLSEREWHIFSSVGLQGRLADGGADITFRGQLAMRNAIGAQVALTTGMRLNEFHSLLLCEIGADEQGDFGSHVTLQACAKGGRERSVYIPPRVLARLGLYIATERQAMLAGSSRLKTSSRASLFVVDSQCPHGTWLSGELDGVRIRRTVKAMKPALRVRTFRDTGDGLEPMSLFVNFSGRMPSKDSWHRAFREASARMSFVLGPTRSTRPITPHMLRHTFATTMLKNLEQTDGTRKVSLDPIVEVQRMLGHASLATTSIYLGAQNELSDEVEAAFASWTEESQDYGSLIDQFRLEKFSGDD
ncbi:site-specific integrase [Cryobacterium sp. TMT1-2-1]|uniref:tyrosine-type recombinase/integrase n=1 Tax=Cryobacterium sp. TMT1-2-1 TaxID=1259232 RepID=UPI00141B5ED0|nr:site-specific integrase [Cryobacterium sp. TMT1-2-1]